jgi:hypothetical protein
MTSFESKLLPILRQGVAVIQMILYKKVRDHLSHRHPYRLQEDINKLSAAVINDVFGLENTKEPFKSFAENNRDWIDEVIENIPEEMADVMGPVTDALRITVLCDSQEGRDTSAILERAHDRRLLVVSREIPLPARFISLVRELGSANDILLPPEISTIQSEN